MSSFTPWDEERFGPTADKLAREFVEYRKDIRGLIDQLFANWHSVELAAARRDLEIAAVREWCGKAAEDLNFRRESLGSKGLELVGNVAQTLHLIATTDPPDSSLLTRSHLQVALNVLVKYFLQNEPENQLCFPADVEKEDARGRVPLEIIVRKVHGRSATDLLAAKTLECDELQAMVDDFRAENDSVHQRVTVLEQALASVREWAHHQAETYEGFHGEDGPEEPAWTPDLTGVDELDSILSEVGA